MPRRRWYSDLRQAGAHRHSVYPPGSGHVATLLSYYAPTLAASQEEKEEFYEQLGRAIDAVPFKQKLLVLQDFNARVRYDTIEEINVDSKAEYTA